MIDRPGYGESVFHRRDADILDDNATSLAEMIGQLRRDHAAGRPIILIGHSIGGAIALMIAARRPAWLGAVSVSGIGDVQPPAATAMVTTPPAADAPPPDLARLIFLTQEAATDEAVAALDRASGQVVAEELLAISTIWPEAISDILSQIVVPTQVLLAEHEILWETGAPVADRLAQALRHAPRKDVAVIPGVAHCIEHHPQARDFYERILRFTAQEADR